MTSAGERSEPAVVAPAAAGVVGQHVGPAVPGSAVVARHVAPAVPESAVVARDVAPAVPVPALAGPDAAGTAPAYTVAVRALCEFAAKHGDLDTRYTPAPTALEGIAGHARVRERRGPGYEAEISLSGRHDDLCVRGRADGFLPGRNRLEEIKTFRGRYAAISERQRALHWAQARIYGHLFCVARGLASLELALVYYDLGKDEETLLTEQWPASELAAHFARLCGLFLDWARQEAVHRQRRDAALRTLRFPLPQFRSGQRELSVAVYRTVRDGGALLAQAPTGVGKTLGTLFPMLRACPDQHIDKVFFLTAKAPGRALAMQALDTLAAHGATPLRVLSLQARDKACEQPGRACHGDDCPLARGFYDRLPAARSAACAQPGAWDRERLRELALAQGICPYYLAQELTRWADVVVGDYNYFYDGSAMLYAQSQMLGWRVAVLADEAHNLVDRARGMYSAALHEQSLREVRKLAPREVRPALEALARRWRALREAAPGSYETHDELPETWLTALHGVVSAVTDHLAEHPTGLDAGLQRFYFDALHFVRLAEQFGPHSLLDTAVTNGSRAASLAICLRNVVPAGFLAPRHAAAWASVLFSATLAPPRYYRDLLGLPPATPWLDVAAPFRAEQLAVRIASHISTRYRDRGASVGRIADEVVRNYQSRPGNHLVFLSSFLYMEQIAEHLRRHHPDWPLQIQRPDMSEAERADFLAGFTADSRTLGFAVLGGAFSEGVDLPGSRLVGVTIATLGLPQLNPVNEQMRQLLEQRYGSGYDYVYLYPGLRKVVQAAGRVIRTEQDEGVLTLIDDRYRRSEVQALLPPWWDLGGARRH